MGSSKKRLTITMFGLLTLLVAILLWQAFGIGEALQKKLGIIGFVVKAPEYFTPDLPGLQPASRFLIVGLPADQTNLNWTITIKSARSELWKTLIGNTVPESGIVWDGRDDHGALIQAKSQCHATLLLRTPGNREMQVKTVFTIGFGLSQKIGRITISNNPIDFTVKRTGEGTRFYLEYAAYESLRPFAEAMAKTHGFQISVWAGRDRNMTNVSRSYTEALQRASTVRQGLIHFGVPPERIRVDVIPVQPGHEKMFDIELAIERPLLDVLSSESGGT